MKGNNRKMMKTVNVVVNYKHGLISFIVMCFFISSSLPLDPETPDTITVLAFWVSQ